MPARGGLTDACGVPVGIGSARTLLTRSWSSGDSGVRRAEPASHALAVAPGGPAARGVPTCAHRGGSQPARNQGLLHSSGAPSPSPLCLNKWSGKGPLWRVRRPQMQTILLQWAPRHPLDPAPIRAKKATLGESPLPTPPAAARLSPQHTQSLLPRGSRPRVEGDRFHSRSLHPTGPHVCGRASNS